MALIKNIGNYFIYKPKLIFLFDGIGALLSATLLYFMLSPTLSSNDYFSLFKVGLIIFPIVIIAFDITFYLFSQGNSKAVLLISLLNLVYIVLSFTFLICFYEILSFFVISYLIGEMLLVSVIAMFEIHLAKRLNLKKNH